MFYADEALEEELLSGLGGERLGVCEMEEPQQQPQEGQAVPQQRPGEQALQVRSR